MIPLPDRKPKAHARPDDANAFFPDPYASRSNAPVGAQDDLGETLAEEFIVSVTSAEESAEDARDELTTEELGGPFVETTDDDELSKSDDEPADAEPEPFPTAMAKP